MSDRIIIKGMGPKEWDQQAEELANHGGFWVLPVSMDMVDVQQVLSMDPALLGGPDRLSFAYPTAVDDGNVVINWESIPTQVTLDDEGKPMVQLGENRLHVVLRRVPKDMDAGDEKLLVGLVRKRQLRLRTLQEREQIRHDAGFLSVPSETGQLLGTPAKAMPGLARLARSETREAPHKLGQGRMEPTTMVTVELTPETISAALDRPAPGRRSRRRKTASLQFPLPHLGRTEGPHEDLPGMVLRTLQVFDTDCMLTLLAAIHYAQRGDGVFPLSPSTIARERGQLGPDGKVDTKRRRIIDRHLVELRRVKLMVTPYGQDPDEVEDTIPLLVEAGMRSMKGRGPTPLLGLNPQIMHRMNTGRLLLMDRRILSADLRKHEWPLRIYWQVFTQLNLNWVAHALHEQGGMALRLTDMLDRAGLPWRELAAERGEPGLVLRVKQSLRELERWLGGSPLLYSELDLGDSLRKAKVIVRPPEAMVEQMNGMRSKAIAHRERMLALPPTQKRRRKARNGSKTAS